MRTHRTKLGLLLAGLVMGVALTVTLDRIPRLRAEKSPATPVPAAPLPSPGDWSQAIVEVAKAVKPSVVNIQVLEQQGSLDEFDPFFQHFRRFVQPEEQVTRLGTGIIINAKGLILTNFHVVGNTNEGRIRAILDDGSSLWGRMIAGNDRIDLAVVQLDLKGKELKAAVLGDSDEIQVGDWVVAIGNAFNLEHTVTSGIVSAKGRNRQDLGSVVDFIQTDAAINPGNSGGPLVNLRGEVIGVNSAIFSRSGGYMGVGFAIPINLAKFAAKEYIAGKMAAGNATDGGETPKPTRLKSGRTYLGVTMTDLAPSIRSQLAERIGNSGGVLVVEVEEGSPAEEAGIRPHDILLSFGEQKVASPEKLREFVTGCKPGEKVPVVVFRRGEKKSLTVQIGER